MWSERGDTREACIEGFKRESRSPGDIQILIFVFLVIIENLSLPTQHHIHNLFALQCIDVYVTREMWKMLSKALVRKKKLTSMENSLKC